MHVCILFSDGYLHNIEDKESLTDMNKGLRSTNDKIFQGGCWYDLHRMLNVSYGDKILYVGDHIYGDILRSKRSLGWRTCLVIPELDHEAKVAKEETSLYTEVLKLRRLQYDLDDYIDLLRNRIKQGMSVFDHIDYDSLLFQ